MVSLYKYSFNLNASHSMDYNKKHSHTFKIVLYIQNNDDSVIFDRYETIIDNYFKNYKGKYINEIEPFDKLVPSLENMAKVFYKKVNEILLDCNLDLKKLEIEDNYTISVSLGEIIMIGSNNRIISNESFNFYKEKILRKYKDIISKVETNEILDFSIKENNIKENETKDFILPIFIEKKQSDYESYENFITNINRTFN